MLTDFSATTVKRTTTHMWSTKEIKFSRKQNGILISYQRGVRNLLHGGKVGDKPLQPKKRHNVEGQILPSIVCLFYLHLRLLICSRSKRFVGKFKNLSFTSGNRVHKLIICLNKWMNLIAFLINWNVYIVFWHLFWVHPMNRNPV